MKIQTKSGFVCDVNENKAKDWRFCKNLAKCDTDDESSVIQGIAFVVPFLLGSDGEEALIRHVSDDDGIASTQRILEEFKEIMNLMSENIKKSQSSQD